MVLGAIWCRKDKTREISEKIRDIKEFHGISRRREIKWTKVSPSKVNFYNDLVNFFFDEKELHFRGLVALEKNKLEHEFFQHDHDTWYYKMYYEMLKEIFRLENSYNVYLDIKDTIGIKKVNKLWEVLSNKLYDFKKEVIKKMQLVRSHESEIMQLTDLLIGTVMYENRRIYGNKYDGSSNAKLNLVKNVKENLMHELTTSTSLLERKFNVFIWSPK